MVDGRKNNGGARKGAGRKPKAVELQFIEKLDNIIKSDEAIEELKKLISKGNTVALKIYFEYRFGKPKETVHNINENYNTDLTPDVIKEINQVLEGAY